MNISLIAAMAKSRVIGKDNKLPWHLPADLKWFKTNTLHKPVIMGRSTFESIGFALPKRQNIVLSRTVPLIPVENVTFVTSLDEAFKFVKSEEEIMIIGGASLYEYTLPMANKLYLTHIDAKIDGDAFFPDYTHLDWKKTFEQCGHRDQKNPYDYVFEILIR